MIFNASWRRTADEYVIPRLTRAHADLTKMVGWLRDVNIDIWTESPSDPAQLTPGREHYSMEGWRAHWRVEFDNLNAFNTAHGALLQGYDSQAKTALDGYLASLPTIATAFNNVRSAHLHQGSLKQALLTQAQRESLATAIEGQLQ